jgi:hypothetical protein
LQQQQIVSFEGCTEAADPFLCADIPAGAGFFTAHIFDDAGEYLFGSGANGGPISLSKQLSKFFIGINDPLGQNPTGAPFNPAIFNLFDAWTNLPNDAAKASVLRGQTIFNSKTINIIGVAGLNDVTGMPVIVGTCGTCHDSFNVGNHSGEGAPKYWGRRCWKEQSASLGHRRIAGLYDLVHVGAVGREGVRSDRPWPRLDHRAMCRYREGEGTNPAWTRGARTIFPQWFRYYATGCS